MQIMINSFEDLIHYLNESDLSVKQTSELVNKGLNLLFLNDYNTKEEMIEILIDYWLKWKHTSEKPIFIDCDPLE